MKKLVMMCVAVVAACAAHAAAVNWNSGTLYLSDGTTKAGKDDITAILWESTSSTAFRGLTAADLYAAKDNPSSISGYAKTVNSTALGAANLKSSATYADGTDVYAAILYINNKEGGYIGNFGNVTAGTSNVTLADLSVYEGGSFGGTPRGGAVTKNGAWGGEGTPEPTSGILLLVGAGILGLRRKQK